MFVFTYYPRLILVVRQFLLLLLIPSLVLDLIPVSLIHSLTYLLTHLAVGFSIRLLMYYIPSIVLSFKEHPPFG